MYIYLLKLFIGKPASAFRIVIIYLQHKLNKLLETFLRDSGKLVAVFKKKQPNSFRSFEFCDVVRYPPQMQPSEDEYTVVIRKYGQQQNSGRLSHLSDAQLILLGTVCRDDIPHTITPPSTSLNHSHRAGRCHAFMLFAPNSDFTV